jgi:Skp family chaperone for outer membrane proteins
MVIGSGARRYALGCLAVAVLMLSGQVQAQAAGDALSPPVIAILDLDQCHYESVAGKSYRVQAEKYQKDFQEDVARGDAAFSAEQQELQQQSNSTPKEVLADKYRGFEQRVAESRHKLLLRRQALEEALAIARGQIEKAIHDAAYKIASERGATMVVPKSQVLLFDEKINITKEVLEAMNESLPRVDVPTPRIPVEGAPTGASTKKSQQ